MTILLFNILMLLMIWIDLKHYNRQITPLAVIGTIYTILIDLNNLILCRIYGYYIVTDQVLLILLGFFSAIFIQDLLFGTLYRSAHKISKKITVRFRNYWIAALLFWIGTAAYSIQFIRLYSSRGLNIKGENNGILGHLSSFAFILGPAVLDLALKSQKKVRIASAAALNLLVLLISVLFGGKYVIFINLSYFILYFLMKRNSQIEIGKIIKIGFILVSAAAGVFFLFYYVIPRATGQYMSTVDFAIQHMFDYLVGSISANNATVLRPGQGDSRIPFTVFINMGKALMGNHDYVKSTYPFIFPIRPEYATNVSGFLGEIIYDLGIGGGLIYTLILFCIINIFCLQYRLKSLS